MSCASDPTGMMVGRIICGKRLLIFDERFF
jgi:hypothetical protein